MNKKVVEFFDGQWDVPGLFISGFYKVRYGSYLFAWYMFIVADAHESRALHALRVGVEKADSFFDGGDAST